MEQPITDAESLAEEPASLVPPRDAGPSVTILAEDGTEVVTDFHFIEEYGELTAGPRVIRVWYSDPAHDDSDYEDYRNASITEVSP